MWREVGVGFGGLGRAGQGWKRLGYGNIGSSRERLGVRAGLRRSWAGRGWGGSWRGEAGRDRRRTQGRKVPAGGRHFHYVKKGQGAAGKL